MKNVFILDSSARRDNLIERMRLINPGSENQPIYKVIVQQYKESRSLAQNRLLWMWLKEISEHVELSTGRQFSDEDLNEWFKEKFLETKIIEFRGEIIKTRKSSAKLNTKEFKDYLEAIDRYCAENMNLLLQHPEDLYYKALGIELRKEF